jgi:hypothetical protein
MWLCFLAGLKAFLEHLTLSFFSVKYIAVAKKGF